MTAPLAYAMLAAGLLLAAWSGLWAYLRKPVNGGQIIAGLVLEVTLAVQSVIGVVRLTGDAAVVEPVTFVAYAVGILAPLALGIWIARIERTRWGSIAFCFTAVVVAVMVLRLLQLWQMGDAGV